MAYLKEPNIGRRIVVGRMSPEDLGEIIRLEKESFTDPWPKKGFEVQLADGASIMLTARLMDSSSGVGEIVGYLCAYHILEELQLASVAVKEAFRRQGIARRLILEMIWQGREQGAKEIWLDVRESNAAARRLYGELGFGEMYRRKNYYRKPKEDSLVLFRPVEEAALRPAALGPGQSRGR